LRAVLRDDGVPNAYPAGALRQTRTRAHASAVERPVRMRRRVRHHRTDRGSEVERAIAVGVGAEKLEERTGPRMQRVRLGTRGWRSGVLESQIHADSLDTRKGAAQRQCGRPVAQPALPMQLV
jgi:hypothetical protein